MAVKNFYLANALSDSWRRLSETPQSLVSLADGWTVGTGNTNHSEYFVGVKRLATTFTGTTVPDGTLDLTNKDAFRSELPLNGSFANANWTFKFGVIGTVAVSAAGRVRFRLIKANADGSNATEITSAQQQTNIVTLSLTAQVPTLTFNPGAFTITNQYLFIQLAWERTTAGSMSTADCLLRTGQDTSVGTSVVTADYTEFPKVQLTGIARDTSRKVSTGLDMVSYATPIRAAAKVGCALLLSALTLGSSVSRDSGAATGVLTTKQPLAGAVRSAPAATGVLQTTAPPPSFGVGQSQATGRALATSLDLVSYATPSRGHPRLAAPLTSRLPLTAAARTTPRAAALLSVTLPGATQLTGVALSESRATAALQTRLALTATRTQSSPRLLPATLPSRLDLRSGGTVAPARALNTAALSKLSISGLLRSQGRVWASLLTKTGIGTATARIAPRAVGELGLKADIGIDLPNVSTSGMRSNVSVLSWNHTVTGLGPERALAILFCWKSSPTQVLPTGVTFNGLPCSAVGNAATSNANPTWLGAHIWYLRNPPVGTFPIVVQFNGTISAGIGSAVLFNAVSATLPFAPPAYGFGNGSNNQALAVVPVTSNKEVPLDAVVANLAPILTVGGGQAQLVNQGTAGVVSGAMSYEQPATLPATDMSWSLSANQIWAMFATAALPAGVNMPQLRGVDPSAPRGLSRPFDSVAYATPARGAPRVVGRLQTVLNVMPSVASGRVVGQLHFGGGPTTFLAGSPSRNMPRALGLLELFYYATPMRDSGRAFGTRLRLVYHTAPSLASPLLRTPLSLGLAGQAPPTGSRGSAGRATGRLSLHYATAPVKGGTSRSIGSLQFAGGPKILVSGRARLAPRAKGELTFGTGARTSLEGMARASARLINASKLEGIYYATPSRSSARLRGPLWMIYGAAPIVNSGMARAVPFGNARDVVGLRGVSMTTARLVSGMATTTHLVGYARAQAISGSLLPQLAQVLTGRSRASGVFHCAPMAFSPEVIVDIGTGQVRIASRAVASLRQFWAAAPSCATPLASGQLQQSIGLGQGVVRETSLAHALLTMAGPTIRQLEGLLRAHAIVTAAIRTWHVATPARSSGRVSAAQLHSHTMILLAIVRDHPRAGAVLAFTGGTQQLLIGRLLSEGRVLGHLSTHVPAQPVRASVVLAAQLQTTVALAGCSASTASLHGGFADPYALAVSVGPAGLAVGIFVSALPVNGGHVLGGGVVRGTLRVPLPEPTWIFEAKHRQYVFEARVRPFVILAKARTYIFPA